MGVTCYQYFGVKSVVDSDGKCPESLGVAESPILPELDSPDKYTLDHDDD